MNYHSNPSNSSIAKVHQAQFREETNLRDHAKTGSDDPEGAGQQVFGPKMSKSEAQVNRVRSGADTGSSETKAGGLRSVEEMTWVLILDLEHRLTTRLEVTHPVFAWLVEHAVDLHEKNSRLFGRKNSL